MKVLVVKDGTVPILVAEVLFTDYGPELTDEDGLGDEENENVEVFSVEGKPEALDVTWADSMGFSVDGTTVKAWMADRQADETGGPIEEVSSGHLVQSDISHGDDESWYSHLFDLRRN